ncbi:CynX/NimT family MFS transporter [Lichenihabitans psoromatis]|uniref:CynX/NimT family MFS transporter n=1 Tax=Lichenihabitans psoromatis TaxID=2528642 RepID=UPI001036DB24|nr:CynX/NimT family MFS transporter [Lichenihabitans psoromatis]
MKKAIGHVATSDAELLGEPLIDAEADTFSPEPIQASGSRLLLGASLVLIALNLRPVFSSVAALLPEITQSTGLHPGAASLMTTLPVLCLGLFAPFAPGLARRFGAERTIMMLLLVLGIGTALRGLGTFPALLAGAILAGGSIAVVNVLLPGLVKRDFPDRLALMTGLFTMALSAGAAAAAGFTVPLEHWLGNDWSAALAIWAAPVGLVLLLWAPQALAVRHVPARTSVRGPSLWRSGLAWRVTLFMGLQSALAYCVFGYLAPILRERGLSGTTAGLVVSFSVIVQCIACMLAPVIAVRQRDQRVVNAAFFAVALLGLLACMFAPLGGIWLWATLQGFGQGGLIALAMTAIVLRSPDAQVAARLSSMAQSVGYTLASLGPLLVGVLRGTTGSYAAAGFLFVCITLVGMWSGIGAGRATQLLPEGS